MKIKTILLIISSLFLSSILYGQKMRTVQGSFSYPIPDGQSIGEARHYALKYAKTKILADTFGTTVHSSSFIQSDNGDQRYMSLNETEVLGEWVQTVGEPVFERSIVNDHFVLTVTVTGKVREVTRAKTDLKVRIMRNGLGDRFISDSFVEGDYIYLSFLSPVNGYLVVYMSDGKQAQRMLPYHLQEGGSVKIYADQTYIFFSPDYSYPGIDDRAVQRYRLSCDSSIEMDRLYVVFSPHEFTKPAGRKGGDIIHPESLSFHDFQSWIGKIQRQDKSLNVVAVDLTVKKADNDYE